MALEDFKDKLQDQLAELRSKIEESPIYHSIRERYENLSPSAQRTLALSLLAGGIIFFCYIPYAYFSSSSVLVSEFNEKRSMIRQLLRASRLASQAGTVSNPPEISALQSTIMNRLARFNLLPEQSAGINIVSAAALGGSLAPAGITQEGLSVNLKQLNLKQVVDIGYDLQNLAQGVRLVGMNMSPTAADTRYFDVIFHIARFSMPGVSAVSNDAGAGAPPSGQNSGSRSRGANSGAAARPRFSPPPGSQNQNDAGAAPPPDNGSVTNGEMGQDEQGEPQDFEGE